MKIGGKTCALAKLILGENLGRGPRGNRGYPNKGGQSCDKFRNKRTTPHDQTKTDS